MKLQKSQTLKKRTTPKFRLVQNRRAINTVVANMILIAAVIVMGFVVLSYVRSNSNNYQTEYQQTVNSGIEKLKETLSYEYTYYNASARTLQIYFMNAGTINLQVDKIYLNTATESYPYKIFDLNGQETTDRTITVSQERSITINDLTLTSGTYTVKITTTRGLNFANTFVC